MSPSQGSKLAKACLVYSIYLKGEESLCLEWIWSYLDEVRYVHIVRENGMG